MSNRQRQHLTPKQRQAFADLFGQCDLVEALLCVQGIVRHNVENFALADDAANLITKAANLIAKEGE